MADKVTAAAITVIVAGTVSVGAVAIQHTQKPSKPTPGHRVARARAGRPGGRARTRGDEARGQASPRAPPQARRADTGRGGSPPGPCRLRRRPSRRRPPSPARPRDPRARRPRPPRPRGRARSSTSGGISAAHLALGPIPGHRTVERPTFGESMRGDCGRTERQGRRERLSGLHRLAGWVPWIVHDPLAVGGYPEGQYRYAADATLTSAMLSTDDGSTEFVFSGRYSLSSIPVHRRDTGCLTTARSRSRLGFWGDGTLYATSVSMDES